MGINCYNSTPITTRIKIKITMWDPMNGELILAINRYMGTID